MKRQIILETDLDNDLVHVKSSKQSQFESTQEQLKTLLLPYVTTDKKTRALIGLLFHGLQRMQKAEYIEELKLYCTNLLEIIATTTFIREQDKKKLSNILQTVFVLQGKELTRTRLDKKEFHQFLIKFGDTFIGLLPLNKFISIGISTAKVMRRISQQESTDNSFFAKLKILAFNQYYEAKQTLSNVKQTLTKLYHEQKMKFAVLAIAATLVTAGLITLHFFIEPLLILMVLTTAFKILSLGVETLQLKKQSQQRQLRMKTRLKAHEDELDKLQSRTTPTPKKTLTQKALAFFMKYKMMAVLISGIAAIGSFFGMEITNVLFASHHSLSMAASLGSTGVILLKTACDSTCITVASCLAKLKLKKAPAIELTEIKPLSLPQEPSLSLVTDETPQFRMQR